MEGGAQGLVTLSATQKIKVSIPSSRNRATVHRTVAVSYSSPSASKAEKVQHLLVLDFFWQGHKDLNPEPTVLE